MSSVSGSRKCHVVKKESEEFEFFLTADEERRGQIITSVTRGGPASRGGLKDGDRILEINGISVETKDHGDIVALIRDCIPTNEIKFVVVDKENDPNFVKTDRPSRQSSKVEPRPRLCKIKKKNNSFGFFLERDSKGDLVKQVTKGGAADGTGLKQGDRLIAVGKKNVEKMQHKQVVELIKSAGNKVSLLVIDEEGYDHCKTNNIPITEKMVRGSTSSRTSSSSSSKDKSVKTTTSSKSKKQSVKESVKSRVNPHKGKVRVVHLLKHPSNGYGFYLRSVSNSSGEFIGKIDPDSSAELAGLFESDRVVAVNGKSIMEVNHADVISQIKTKKSQVVLIVLDEEAMKHFEENESFPGTDDIVLTYNPAIRTVKLTKGAEGYGMFLKVEKERPSFHILTDVNENGVAGQAGLKNGEIVVAVNGSGVLKDNHAGCVQKIKNAGESVELTVGSTGTCEFLSKADVEVTSDFIKEWPTEEDFEVPSFGKTAKTVAVTAAVAEVVETVTAKDDEKLGMKPRLCRVVRGAKGYGFVLKEGDGHFLINIEHGSAAFDAGILEYDRIVEVNGEGVDKLKHSELVSAIKASGNEVTFLVVNKEEDTFFKEKGIPITAALLDIKDELSDDDKPRVCKLVRKPDGYGFHLTGEAGREGQFIKDVQKGSAADEGGLRDGDRIIEVNGNSVIGESHDDIVKRITENKNEVTFLVIDKKGDTYYKLKGIKVVATMVVAKELIEEIAEEIQSEEKEEEQQQEESRSIGEESAASSAIETEATVHKEPEVDDSTLETIATVIAVKQIAEKVEEIREDDAQSISEDQTKSTEEDDEHVEEQEERREEILEDVVKVAAVAAVAVHAAEKQDESDDEKRQVEEEVHDEESVAEEVVENIQDTVEDIKEQIEDKSEEQEDERDLSDVAKPLVAAAVVAHALQEDDAESDKSSRPPSPSPSPQVEDTVLNEETKEAIQEIIEDHAEASEHDEEHLKEIAAAAVVIANEMSDRASDREEESDKEEMKDELKAAAALVHQEILDRSKEIEEPESPREVKPVAVAVVIKATTPPPSPVVVERERPLSPKEKPDPVPLAVVLTANGDIPKLKPTSPPPANNEPKIIWGQRNLKPITKQISVGAAASIAQPKNDDAKVESGPVKMSTVAALKAELERRHRQQQAAVVRNTVQDELAELSKQSGGATKHMAMFGGSVKKPQSSGPKKNQWVGEGMTIKIIET